MSEKQKTTFYLWCSGCVLTTPLHAAVHICVTCVRLFHDLTLSPAGHIVPLQANISQVIPQSKSFYYTAFFYKIKSQPLKS